MSKKFTHFQSKEAAEAGRGWVIFDATDRIVGRLATEVATRLRGKDKPQFTPHNDGGDFVVVINVEKMKFSGRKLAQKVYRYHTGYTGGLVEETAEKMMNRKPEEALRLAVRGMLPKTAQGKRTLKKLKLYRGEIHPHQAQLAGE